MRRIFLSTETGTLKLKKMKSIEGSKHFIRRMRKTSLLLVLLALIFGCSKNDDPEAASKVTIVTINPQSPASLSFGQRVTISYDYEVLEPEGVRIWVMPYSDGLISPKYSYTSSPLFKGTGSRDVTFTITSGESEMVVDQLKIKIADSTGDVTILEYFETVDYTFGP